MIKEKLKNFIKSHFFIDFIIGIITILVFITITYIIKPFLLIIALVIRKGYEEIFLGNLDLSYFFTAFVIIMCLFFYISLFLFLYFFIAERAKQKDEERNGIKETMDYVLKTKKNWFILALTVTISISFMYAGTLFLSTAFPTEPLFIKGSTSTSGSNLKCNCGDYFNIISTHDVSCKLELSNEFKDKELKKAEVKYFINRTEFKEEIDRFNKESVTLIFNKKKYPQFLLLTFEKGSEEEFALPQVGVFTKEEYYKREKEKAVWFFAIISFSLFSVFSAMGNLKRIVGWK